MIRSFVEKIPASIFLHPQRFRCFGRAGRFGGVGGDLSFCSRHPSIGGSGYFKQERLQRWKSLCLLKFRTMFMSDMVNGEQPMTSKNDPRITRVGRFLRKTHLDEWPQFLNVLHGEMSLVGPRSERREFVQIFQEKIPFYRARMLVKPGITGWAQINKCMPKRLKKPLSN